MAHEENSYQYRPLTQGWYIRLLIIEPSDPNEPLSPLKINLVEQHLHSADFDALSYVWGDQAQKFLISCNGHDLWIGRNLHDALLEYRRRRPVQGLWADAICVNQACETEKTQQVRMMKEIYGTAIRTIIWLGQLQPSDIEGIRLAKLIDAKCGKEDYNHQEDGLSSTNFDCKARGIPDVVDNHLSISPSWSALFNILTHPWFGRVWIVQELLVSRNPEMWRGEKSVSTDVLLFTALLVGGKRDLRMFFGMTHDPSHFPAQSVAICRHRYRTIDHRPIWDIMGFTTGMEATDIRDRYFALAGISTGDLSEFVSYSRTLEQIASQVGLMALLGTPEYQMMDGLDSLADHPSLRLQSQDLRISSWIPDLLSKQLRGFELAFVYSTPRLRSRNLLFPFPEIQIVIEDSEGRLRPAMVPSSPYFYPKVREMWIKAWIFDRIKAVILPITEEPVPSQSERPLKTFGRFSADCLRRIKRYSVKIIHFVNGARILADSKLTPKDDIRSGDAFEAFWRTLVYNRAGDDPRDEQKPQEWIGTSFVVWYMMAKFCLTNAWKNDFDLFMTRYKALLRLSNPFMQAFDRMYGSRSFFVSESGRVGWAPLNACPGYSVAAFWGNRIPFVAKPVDGGVWEYAGGCYVHGCMDGEISANANKSEWEFMRFV